MHLIAAQLPTPLPDHLGLTAAETTLLTFAPPPCLVADREQVIMVDSVERLHMLNSWMFDVHHQLPSYIPQHLLAPGPIHLPYERVVGFDVENIVDGFYKYTHADDGLLFRPFPCTRLSSYHSYLTVSDILVIAALLGSARRVRDCVRL